MTDEDRIKLSKKEYPAFFSALTRALLLSLEKKGLLTREEAERILHGK